MPVSRIAVLIDNIESDYHIEMLMGAVRAARSTSYKVLIVAGGWISAPLGPTLRNFVYDLAARSDIAGVVVMAGSLSNFCGFRRFEEWLAGFGNLPVVCTQLKVAGRASVYVDNGAGMYAAVSHLIEQHRHRRIAFVRGPSASAEAEARFIAYQKALTDHGIEPDGKLVFEGYSLSRDDGEQAVRAFLEERGIEASNLDAIACVNDDVALGTLEALDRRGIVVPEQMAVVGFDDGPNARAANPPLTTVNQRVELQGYTAARVLIESLEKGVAPQSAELMSEAVIRGSCGCRIRLQNDSSGVESSRPGLARKLSLALIEHRTVIRAELARAASGRLGSQKGWEEALLNSLAVEMERADASFVQTLEAMARRLIAGGATVDPCSDVLTQLRLQILRLVALEPELRPHIEDAFQEARLMLTTVALSAYRERDQASLAHVRAIAKACYETVATGDFQQVAALISHHMLGLGIRAGTISRLVSVEGAEPQLHMLARQVTELRSSATTVMPASQLGIDSTLEHQPVVVILPLDFAGAPVGIASFAWGAHNPILYEQFRELFSVAVHAVRM